MSEDLGYRYLVDPLEAREALRSFERQPIIGLDTETYFDFETRQYRLSLLQIAAPSGEALVIDAFSAGIDEARTLIADASVLMAAHNARYDEGALRAAGFESAGFVDTLRLARRALALPSFSLASVAAHLCGVTMDKSFQQSDWRRRPLSHEQLHYAALDARIALRVYEELASRLAGAGRWEAELARARLNAPAASASDASARKKMGATLQLRPLTPEETRALKRLREWRRRTAHDAGLPAYMICPDKTLEHLLITRPGSLDQLSVIYGLGPAKIARYGNAILDCLKAL
ncbi:MAG: HRDC domain-containing protein [Blastocatellales bacterium]|nr:HRDC domain-containing protein [Blastocatellales bacterium]